MSKLQSAMNSYHLYEGTQKGRELDEAWLKKTQEEHEKKDPSYKWSTYIIDPLNKTWWYIGV